MSPADALANVAAPFVPRGRVSIDVSPLTASPGDELSGHVTYSALDEPRLLRALEVHLQLTTTVLHTVAAEGASAGMPPSTETRDLVLPLVLCTDLPVPAGKQWTAPYRLRLPHAALPATVPGKLDYHVVARAAVDGEAVGAWANASVFLAAATGTVAPQTSLHDLLPHELFALAALIRALVRADGRFTPQESAAIARIAAAENAADLLWTALSTSAQKAQSDTHISAAVASVKRPEARARILAVLDDLAIADGIQLAGFAVLSDIHARWPPTH